MKRFFFKIFQLLIILLVIVILLFVGLVIYNYFVEEEKRIDITSIFNGQFLASSSQDDFDIIDEPVINEALEVNYFYSQLDEDGKAIYTALNENKDNMKTGTYKIDFGTAFTNTLKKDDGKELLGDSYQSAIEAFVYDNPDVFYLNVNNMYLNIQKTTKGDKVKYEVSISQGTNENYLSDEFSSKEEIDQYEEQIENVANSILANVTGTKYQKLLKIHDYLVDNVNYDKEADGENIYNIYGALVDKECVCEGYAKAFKYLANKAGIDCIIVAGTAKNSVEENESHAWNYVSINDVWYAVDVTWDDPIIIGSGKVTSDIKYKYFLKGNNTINKDHTSNGQFTDDGKIFEYPTLSQKDYE